jgi:hypothetical protein
MCLLHRKLGEEVFVDAAKDVTARMLLALLHQHLFEALHVTGVVGSVDHSMAIWAQDSKVCTRIK